MQARSCTSALTRYDWIHSNSLSSFRLTDHPEALIARRAHAPLTNSHFANQFKNMGNLSDDRLPTKRLCINKVIITTHQQSVS